MLNRRTYEAPRVPSQVTVGGDVALGGKVFSVQPRTARTRVIREDLHPRWNEAFTFVVPELPDFKDPKGSSVDTIPVRCGFPAGRSPLLGSMRRPHASLWCRRRGVGALPDAAVTPCAPPAPLQLHRLGLEHYGKRPPGRVERDSRRPGAPPSVLTGHVSSLLPY